MIGLQMWYETQMHGTSARVPDDDVWTNDEHDEMHVVASCAEGCGGCGRVARNVTSVDVLRVTDVLPAQDGGRTRIVLYHTAILLDRRGRLRGTDVSDASDMFAFASAFCDACGTFDAQDARETRDARCARCARTFVNVHGRPRVPMRRVNVHDGRTLTDVACTTTRANVETREREREEDAEGYARRARTHVAQNARIDVLVDVDGCVLAVQTFPYAFLTSNGDARGHARTRSRVVCLPCAMHEDDAQDDVLAFDDADVDAFVRAEERVADVLREDVATQKDVETRAETRDDDDDANAILIYRDGDAQDEHTCVCHACASTFRAFVGHATQNIGDDAGTRAGSNGIVWTSCACTLCATFLAHARRTRERSDGQRT